MLASRATPSGLCVRSHFMAPAGYRQLVRKSIALDYKLHRAAQAAIAENGRTYLSRQHNLPTQEHFKRLRIDKSECQYFERYGEEGHRLTYFIGNKNLPDFIRPLVQAVDTLPEVMTYCGELERNFTFNTYRAVNTTRAGFDFHVDTPSNGEITTIYTLLSEAVLEMRVKGQKLPSFSCVLEPNSLLLLSGDARWLWEHRVLTQEAPNQHSDIQRISLVYGCKRAEPKPSILSV